MTTREEFEAWWLGADLPIDSIHQEVAKDYAWEAWQHQQQRIDALQAKVDALMLEYCQDDMTPEQIANWGANQRPVDAETKAQIERAIRNTAPPAPRDSLGEATRVEAVSEAENHQDTWKPWIPILSAWHADKKNAAPQVPSPATDGASQLQAVSPAEDVPVYAKPEYDRGFNEGIEAAAKRCSEDESGRDSGAYFAEEIRTLKKGA